MTVMFDPSEGEYVTKDLPWMITPLLSREELKHRIELGQIQEL